MKITYDPEADALYIELRDVRAHDSVDVEEGVTADLDEKGHIIGLEVLDASERLSPDELTSVHYENLLLSEAAVKPRPRRRRPAAARR
jgi:uncharacterized protein YuzE